MIRVYDGAGYVVLTEERKRVAPNKPIKDRKSKPKVEPVSTAAATKEWPSINFGVAPNSVDCS